MIQTKEDDFYSDASRKHLNPEVIDQGCNRRLISKRRLYHAYQSSYFLCCVSCMEKPEGEIIRHDVDVADSTV